MVAARGEAIVPSHSESSPAPLKAQRSVGAMAGLVHLVREQWPVFLAAFGAAGAAAKFFLRDQEVETIRDRTIAAWNALDDIKRACISWLPQKAVARTTLVIIGTVLVQGPQIYLYLDDFKTISQYGWRAWALFVALLSFAIILGLPFFGRCAMWSMVLLKSASQS